MTQIIDRLHSVIVNAPRLPGDMVVYRGVDDRYRNLKPGDTVTDVGFNSTSADGPSAAMYTIQGTWDELKHPEMGQYMLTFKQSPMPPCCLFEIELPKGTPALWFESEQEVLLDKGRQYMVTNVESKEVPVDLSFYSRSSRLPVIMQVVRMRLIN